jgi:hypothetical protein
MSVPAEHCTLNFFSFVLHSVPIRRPLASIFFAPLLAPQGHRFADDEIKRRVRGEHLQFRYVSDATRMQRRKPRWESLLKMEAFISAL